MLFKLFSVFATIQIVLSKPQGITFNDGKVGVNFGGYHAEAGLGGLLTGNAAHGGLSASAGTPSGQLAGAGLGGSLDGRTAGGLYAGATAGGDVGASAALGGTVDSDGAYGGSGAEAHAGGVGRKVVTLSQSVPNQPIHTVTAVQETVPVVSAPAVEYGGQVNTATRIGGDVNSVSSIQQPAVNVQKIKTIRQRPRPQLVYRKQFLFPRIYTKTYQVQPANQFNGFNYHKFYNFGAFSNAAAGFGGVAPLPPPPPQLPLPQRHFVVEKRFGYQPITYNKEIHSTSGSALSAGAAAGVGAGAGATAGAGTTATTGTNLGTYTVDVGAAKRAFFTDIFNIPINVLRSVNTFVGNTASNGYGFQKTVRF